MAVYAKNIISGSTLIADLIEDSLENDLPVSQPVVVETQIDCQNGFQVYQIDWHKID